MVVLGYVIRGPLGGLAWHHLNYVLCLARLGHDVWFIEDSDDYPSCYDPVRGHRRHRSHDGPRLRPRQFERLGVGDRWAYHDAHSGRWLGAGAPGAVAACRRADLVLNVSGVNPLRDWVAGAPARALIDTDPAFTQLRHIRDPAAREEAERHSSFFTFGENIPAGRSTVPDDGFPWQPTRQPIDLVSWP